MNRLFASLSLALLALLSGRPVLADDARSLDDPLKPRRYELGAFPILAGSSDIGFEFGGAGTLTHFYDNAFPYDWNVDLLLAASIKDDNLGLRIAQQNYVVRLDAPDFFSSRLRLDTRGSFLRAVNAGYYGLGNAAAAAGYSYEYTQEEGRVRSIGRIHTGVRRLDFAFGANLRFETPKNPDDGTNGAPTSKLTPDVQGANPVAIGLQQAFLGGLAAGLMLDTRNSEFVTTQGFFYQVGLGATVGSAENVAYGEAGAVLAHYAPLGGPFSFAARFVASFKFGRVPFYDLQQGGVFEPQNLVGGETGVRGVPQGRYAGRVKMISNMEVRATPFPTFMLFGDRFRIGMTAFVDAGRVWDHYSLISAADGNSVGLKYGIGGGIFLQWGLAAIFRLEAAYSPDATSENPKLPLGIYVSDGLMF